MFWDKDKDKDQVRPEQEISIVQKVEKNCDPKSKQKPTNLHGSKMSREQ